MPPKPNNLRQNNRTQPPSGRVHVNGNNVAPPNGVNLPGRQNPDGRVGNFPRLMDLEIPPPAQIGSVILAGEGVQTHRTPMDGSFGQPWPSQEDFGSSGAGLLGASPNTAQFGMPAFGAPTMGTAFGQPWSSGQVLGTGNLGINNEASGMNGFVPGYQGIGPRFSGSHAQGNDMNHNCPNPSYETNGLLGCCPENGRMGLGWGNISRSSGYGEAPRGYLEGGFEQPFPCRPQNFQHPAPGVFNQNMRSNGFSSSPAQPGPMFASGPSDNNFHALSNGGETLGFRPGFSGSGPSQHPYNGGTLNQEPQGYANGAPGTSGQFWGPSGSMSSHQFRGRGLDYGNEAYHGVPNDEGHRVTGGLPGPFGAAANHQPSRSSSGYGSGAGTSGSLPNNFGPAPQNHPMQPARSGPGDLIPHFIPAHSVVMLAPTPGMPIQGPPTALPPDRIAISVRLAVLTPVPPIPSGMVPPGVMNFGQALDEAGHGHAIVVQPGPQGRGDAGVQPDRNAPPAYRLEFIGTTYRLETDLEDMARVLAAYEHFSRTGVINHGLLLPMDHLARLVRNAIPLPPQMLANPRILPPFGRHQSPDSIPNDPR